MDDTQGLYTGDQSQEVWVSSQLVILKQEMLSKGGEAAISREAGSLAVDKTDVLLMGTLRQYNELCKKLKMQPFGLRQLAEEIKTVLNNYDNKEIRTLRCRELHFKTWGAHPGSWEYSM